ncbi:unnamed protein product [Didymodactylos carnosus]|uniref:NmrA-like family domain-containing protein 1 n=1 Tax=Didymodactylos carnosus TaxID=1234261 RepID=A0A8S2ESF8_9BILA|nr:unnamed protein product [Didymodactylos carnosus]CAF4099489.1 unnamed protein product [Didymodactylos carnosus]
MRMKEEGELGNNTELVIMCDDKPPVIVVCGATGAQGGAVVRALVETGKYKIRCLTRDPSSSKSQRLQQEFGSSADIELIKCDLQKRDDVRQAFQGVWAIFALTDFWANPTKPELEIDSGRLMADVAAENLSSTYSPYFIYSCLENVEQGSGGKISSCHHFTNKAKIRDYIRECHPNLKTIYVEPAFYIQNWQSPLTGMTQRSSDGTIEFLLPLTKADTIVHQIDITDFGKIVAAILEDPEKLVNKEICACGEAIKFKDIARVFTQVTGILSKCRTLSDEECRQRAKHFPKDIQDEFISSKQWAEEYGYYGKKTDSEWDSGKKLVEKNGGNMNTFERFLKKTGWTGPEK